jgi:Tfp pilus assembly protein PilW
MVLGLVLFAGALQWYQVVKISNFSDKHKKKTLDVGRTVFQFVRQDLQSSGYRGSRTRDLNFPLRRNFEQTSFFTIDRSVFGFQAAVGACKHHLPQRICNHIKANSDVLIIYNIPQEIYVLQTSMVNPTDPILLQPGEKIQKESLVLISDVLQGDVFIANDIKNDKLFHQAGKNTTNTLSKCYQKNAEVTELQTVVYYLGISERVVGDEGTYSLFRSDITQKSEEIVEGIVGFSVEYGVRTGEAWVYKKSDAINSTEWPSVRLIYLKIETKGAMYYGKREKNHIWEYVFTTRNGHRINTGFGAANRHLADFQSQDGSNDFND